jgi:hypothetical protein
VEYRSGWELEVAKYLDLDPKVKEYEYESITIEYLSNTRTGKIRTYYPDFLITYKDGTKKLVEVKRRDKLNDPKVIKKAKAAEAWCAKQEPKVIYEFWTNMMIEAFRKINEASGLFPKLSVKKKKKRIKSKK